MAYNYSRYQNIPTFKNVDPSYINQFTARKVNNVVQHTTVEFGWSPNFDVEKEYWGVGFRFYKLADKYYGDTSLWWIIPWFNQKPLESDFEAGDPVLIPLPLERVLSFFR